MAKRSHFKRMGRAVYHHDQQARGLDIRPGDIVVMPGQMGATAWRVARVDTRIEITPLRSKRAKRERSTEQ